MTEGRSSSVAPRAGDPSGRLRLVVFCSGHIDVHPVPASGNVVIGRGEEADVRIDHATVSRKHATIVVGDEICIIDHGSSNGTTIDGEKIAPSTSVVLGMGRVAELGEAMVLVQAAPPGAGVRSGIFTAVPPRPDASPGMQYLHRVVDHLAPTNLNILVRGEAGVGKEVIANLIHRRSPRAAKPFVRVTGATLEAELGGGNEKGEGGTVFLDEVGDLAPALQDELAGILERAALAPGTGDPLAVGVRWIASTDRSLAVEVARGAFRRDLYERLNEACVTVPPLRDRVDEIPRLSHELVGRFCKEARRAVLPISDAAMAVLKTYRWPGNVSELRDVIERAVRSCKTIAIAPEHLQLPVERPSRPASGKSPSRHPSAAVRDEIDRET